VTHGSWEDSEGGDVSAGRGGGGGDVTTHSASRGGGNGDACRGDGGGDIATQSASSDGGGDAGRGDGGGDIATQSASSASSDGGDDASSTAIGAKEKREKSDKSVAVCCSDWTVAMILSCISNVPWFSESSRHLESARVIRTPWRRDLKLP
jgi:hypothetical protein